ncbi:MAG: 30S ribosomal protein S1, partial [Dermabacter sp.]|nr:30S ribosomal protein S1 [Dermabacter sp.]
DIDLERRRISLSLKQANDGVDPEGDDSTFDPALYGMAAEYDDNGEYKYPEGFDPETNEWLEGFDTQREAWEADYARAYERWTQHKAQVAEAIKADSEAATSSSSDSDAGATSYQSASSDEGTLASDEALAALREKLTGN